MTLDEETLKRLEDQVPELTDIALKQAYWQALASGSSVLEAEGGFIYEVFPDGTRKPVKQILPPTPVKIGQKLVLP
ncbi:MAG: hypothetical protein K8T91_21140 [Planctomycetes bacterium]|nr:hypothetical protein [Planctomycetota bacterium]